MSIFAGESDLPRVSIFQRLSIDARAVLRTFLGLREILWEFGFRRDQATRSETQPEKGAERSTRRRAAGAARRARVQRVDVKG